MLVLGIDTSSPACAVAVCRLREGVAGQPPGAQVEVLAERATVDGRRHGELLAPTIEALLAEAGAERTDLTAVAVGLGPGPFTSLRVGIVTAACLADALGIPAYGICSLDALALDLAPTGAVLVASDARRREVYWAAYDDGVRVAGPSVDRPDEVAAQRVGRQVVGAGAVLYAGVFGTTAAAAAYPTGSAVVRVAAPLLGGPAAPLEPMYLRRPDAAEPAPGAAEPPPGAGR